MTNENEKPKFVCNLTYEQELFLQAHSSRVNENYFIPFWFRRIEGSKYEMIPLGNLPDSMCREIEEMREQIDRTRITKFLGFDIKQEGGE